MLVAGRIFIELLMKDRGVNFRRLAIILILAFISANLYSGTYIEDESTSSGVDFPRQQLEVKLKTSGDQLGARYDRLYLKIKNSSNPDKQHQSEMLQLFKQEHESWLVYRDNHCRLQSYVYAYPAQSKLAHAQYNSCLLKLNEVRIGFIDDLAYEF